MYVDITAGVCCSAAWWGGGGGMLWCMYGLHLCCEIFFFPGVFLLVLLDERNGAEWLRLICFLLF